MAAHDGSVLRRHDLVWLAAGSDPGAFACTARHLGIVRHWVAQRRPLVVARQPEALAPELVALGISLAPPSASQRICLRVPRQMIVRHWQALPLASAIPRAPRAWRPAMAKIDALCRRLDIRVGVYGSLAFQILTRQDYLTPTSDLDLLFDCAPGADLAGLLAGLQGAAAGALRIDGEVRLGDWAVPWRELAMALDGGGPAQVLAKSDRAARLLDVGEFLGQLQAESA